MDPFFLPDEAEAAFDKWLAQVNPGHTALLACDHPDWRMAMAERVMAEFDQGHPVMLDLCETHLEGWQETLTDKLGEDLLADPRLRLHIFHAEHSYLDSLATGRDLWQAWGEAASLPGLVVIYTDLPMLEALQQHAPAWVAACSPVLALPSPFRDLPYESIAKLAASPGTASSLDIGDLLLKQGALAHAEAWYRSVLESETEEEPGRSQLGLGKIAISRAAVVEAIDWIGQALDLLEKPSLRGEGALLLGRAYFSQRQWQDSIEWLQEARQQLNPAEDMEAWGDATRILGRAWEERGHPQEAIDSFLEAAAHFQARPDYSLAAAKVYQQAAAICQNQFRWEEALQHFSAALPLAEQAENDMLIDSLQDSIENMKEQVRKKGGASGKKGFLGRLFS